MIQNIIRFVMKLIKCGICKEALVIEKDYTYINNDCKCKAKVSNKDISMILYTLYGNYYYLHVVKNGEEICIAYKSVFMYGVKLKATSDDIEMNLKSANKNNILMIPTILLCNLAKIHGNDYSISQNAFWHKKSLLVISDANDGELKISESFSCKHKKITYKILFYVLKDYRGFFDQDTTVNTENENFIVYMLDKPFTLDRGYGLYPMLDNKLSKEDIFYSFDEDEIKDTIIELFDRNRSKSAPIG